MANRRYRKQYRSGRGRAGKARRDGGEPGIFTLVSLFVIGTINGVAWLWRLLRKRQAPPSLSSDLFPVPLPSARPSPATVPSIAPLPYRRRPRVMSQGERAFWYPLYRAVQGRYRIFCKVRLQDVVSAPSDANGYWFKKIRGYHLDFVLCDPETTEPLLAVELDDRSHASARQAERDRFKDAVLAAGGVPLYRVPAQQAYDPIQLTAEVDRRIVR